MTEKPLLVADRITKSYVDGARTLTILREASIEIRRGEFVAIVGRSGSGKSTFLHIAGALDQPTSGTVMIDGVILGGLSAGELAQIRAKRVGFIYQFHHLLPEFTALENVLMPGLILNRPQGEIAARARTLLEAVGLGERLGHRPAKLSGGERQRTALARALMNNPDILLADEPTGDLDPATGQDVMEFVVRQTVDQGKALVLVTHDMALAARAHRRLVLEDGALRAA
jgi:lipoprotein-releasing system ATP-binding protein